MFNLPKTFNEFRKVIGGACKKAGAYDDFIDKVIDVNNTTGDIVSALYDAWISYHYVYDLHDNKNSDDLLSAFLYYVDDAVYHAASCYIDLFNHSSRMQFMPFNPRKLTDHVIELLEIA